MSSGQENKITCRQGFYRVGMRATGSTSAQRGPDDTANGLHPVLHITLGAGHEQERLRVGWHLLPLPGTTCKTDRQGLLQGPCAGQEVPSRHPGTQLLLLVCTQALFTPHMGVLSVFFSLALTLVCLYLFICFHIKTEIIKSLTRHYWGEMPISAQLRELQSLRLCFV